MECLQNLAIRAGFPAVCRLTSAPLFGLLFCLKRSRNNDRQYYQNKEKFYEASGYTEVNKAKLKHANTILQKNRSAMRTCVAYELPWSQRFFLLLRGSGSLISFREKSRNPLGLGYLRADCLHIIGILYIFLYVDSRTRLVQV